MLSFLYSYIMEGRVTMSLERKLELLEKRFTQPNAGSSVSEHSLAFDSLSSSSSSTMQRQQHSLHAVERATSRHLAKLTTTTSNSASSNASSVASQETRLASNRQQVDDGERVIAESPPSHSASAAIRVTPQVVASTTVRAFDTARSTYYTHSHLAL